MNVRSLSVLLEERVENSNTAPLPSARVIDVNVIVACVMSESIDTSTSGALDVVISAVDLNVILLILSVPDVTSINEHPLVI